MGVERTGVTDIGKLCLWGTVAGSDMEVAVKVPWPNALRKPQLSREPDIETT